jgi:hypothetical protein
VLKQGQLCDYKSSWGTTLLKENHFTSRKNANFLAAGEKVCPATYKMGEAFEKVPYQVASSFRKLEPN